MNFAPSFGEAVGNERASKHLSCDIPKVELRDLSEWLSTGQTSIKIPLLNSKLAGCTSCATGLIKTDNDVLGYIISLTPPLSI